MKTSEVYFPSYQKTVELEVRIPSKEVYIPARILKPIKSKEEFDNLNKEINVNNIPYVKADLLIKLSCPPRCRKDDRICIARECTCHVDNCPLKTPSYLTCAVYEIALSESQRFNMKIKLKPFELI